MADAAVAASPTARPLPRLRLRPPRDAGAVPGVRYNPGAMRRLRRILVNAAVSASALLCLITAALWIRSYRSADEVNWNRFWYDGRVSRAFENPKHFKTWAGHTIVLHSERGGLRVFYYSDGGRDALFNPQASGFMTRSEPSSRYPYAAMSGLRPAFTWTWGGFQVHHERAS